MTWYTHKMAVYFLPNKPLLQTIDPLDVLRGLIHGLNSLVSVNGIDYDADTTEDEFNAFITQKSLLLSHIFYQRMLIFLTRCLCFISIFCEIFSVFCVTLKRYESV